MKKANKAFFIAVLCSILSNQLNAKGPEQVADELVAGKVKQYESEQGDEAKDAFLRKEAMLMLRSGNIAGVQALQKGISDFQNNPSAYRLKHPTVWIPEVLQNVASLPEKLDPNTAFYNEAVTFKNDSVWQIVWAKNLGSELAATNLGHKINSEGKYIFVQYKVKNISGAPQQIAVRPQIIDDKGNTYDPLDEESLYLENLKTIPMEQLPNGITKTFGSIFEIPSDAVTYYFNAREIIPLNPEKIKILLAHRPEKLGAQSTTLANKKSEVSTPAKKAAQLSQPMTARQALVGYWRSVSKSDISDEYIYQVYFDKEFLDTFSMIPYEVVKESGNKITYKWTQTEVDPVGWTGGTVD